MIALYLIAALCLQICSSTSTVTNPSSPNWAKVYSSGNLRGYFKKLDVSSCVSLLGDAFDYHIASMDTMGSCAVVYSDFECLGYQNKASISNKRIHNTDTVGFNINSIGPCRQDSPGANSEYGETTVTISDNSGSDIREEFTLATGECRNFQNVSALINGIIRLSESLCIQMYEEESCKGILKPFQSFSIYKSIPEYISGEDETIYDEYSKSYKILPEKWQHSKSISLCDLNWIGSKDSVLPLPVCRQNITEGTPTLPLLGPLTKQGYILLWVILIVVFLAIVWQLMFYFDTEISSCKILHQINSRIFSASQTGKTPSDAV